jgi:multiple sugar transport system substrate-binding protein
MKITISVAGRTTIRILPWLGWLFFAAQSPSAGAEAGQTEPLIFLSTQLRPIAEAQKMRNLILADFPREVDYIPLLPREFLARIAAEHAGGRHTIGVLGALPGELQPLVPLDALAPLDDVAERLKDRGIAPPLLTLGRSGAHQLFMPWMQANYIMVASRKALPFLPPGAKLDALGYDQLAAWADALERRTGRRLLGYPAGRQGLMHRFFEGFLYPSFTGGVVVPFRLPAAETMWSEFAHLWKSVNPDSTNWNFMGRPLLSGEVWLAWDHVARLLDALRQRPDEFVAFPAPAGPRGRGSMPVLVGLAAPKDAPDREGAVALIDYLTRPQVQIVTARAVGFFPVVKAALLSDTDPGINSAAAAIGKMEAAKDALPASPPIGLGQRAGEFDSVFIDTFQRIVLHEEPARAVLDGEADRLNRLLAEAAAGCWRPDPPGTGACRAQ